MKLFFHLCCLVLLPVNLLSSENCDKELFGKAEELFKATLYLESIPLYQRIDDPAYKPVALLRQGQSLYYDKQYADALKLLTSISEDASLGELHEDRVLFTAMCLRHLKQYDQAIAYLSRPLTSKYRDEQQMELGLAFYLEGNFKDARLHFEQLDNVKHKSHLYILSRLYLARIALRTGEPIIADQLLESIGSIEDPFLIRETLFLKGEVALQQQRYRDAVHNFDQAYPPNTPLKHHWEKEIAYSRGWSYLKLAENESDEGNKNRLLDKALESFLLISQNDATEKYRLALAQTYLLRAKSGGAIGYAEANKILSAENNFSSLDIQEFVLLMQAEASEDYANRAAAYEQLTDPSKASTSFHAKALYFKALNDYLEADKQKTPAAYQKAAISFETAYSYHHSLEKDQSSNCLQLWAEACWGIGSLEGHVQTLDVLAIALSDYPDEHRWDSLIGPYTMQLIDEQGPERIIARSENTLKERLDRHQSPATFLALADFYAKRAQFEEAYSTYVAFVEKFPNSEEVPKALLQAALSLEMQPGKEKHAQALRKNIYEKYPLSEAAPQAYFLAYTYQDYLQGDRDAIKHLSSFADLFPNSPLLIHVNYMIGLDLKRDRRNQEGKWIRKRNPTQSVQAFTDVEDTFDRLLKEGAIPDNEKEHYARLRYRASLEKGLVHYEVGQESNAAKRDIYLQYAIDVFGQLKIALEDKENPLVKNFYVDNSFPLIYEEGLYWLALSYQHKGDKNAARQIFEEMLGHYQAAGMSGGYYLSRTYYELGMEQLQRGDYRKAYDLFTAADEAAKGRYLSVDEKLDLWLKQSECCKELGENENAMLVLSKVINDDSISHLRLKAMFLRAALYEKMGRPELARRQLESVAKMSGEWAEQAKIRLVNDYATP